MEYTIKSTFDNGTGMLFYNKEELMERFKELIDNAIANGGSYVDISIDTDVSCE